MSRVRLTLIFRSITIQVRTFKGTVMIEQPIYRRALFPRKCIWCEKRTRERVDHDILEIYGFSECARAVVRLPQQHHACHDTRCASAECIRGRQELVKAKAAVARALARRI